MTEWIDAVRVSLAVGGLAFASWTDVRTREAPDGVWYFLALCALPLMALDFDARFGGMAWLLVVPVGGVFLVAFTGGELIPVVPGDTIPDENYEFTPAQRAILAVDLSLSAVIAVVSVLVIALAPGIDLGRAAHPLFGPQALAFAACLMFGTGLLFFVTGALFGGGDAKAFMVLALLFPVAPAVAGLPLFPPATLVAASLPFALVVFVNGALLLVVAGPVIYTAVSRRRGHVRMPESLLAVPKPIGEVNLERDFIMGSVEDGKWRRRLLARQGTHSDKKQKEALEFLKAAGEEVVFVSPKLPFILFMLVGLVLAVAVTSPFYWFAAGG